MLMPFKVLSLGGIVFLAFALMGLMDLIRGLCRVVLASTLLASAPLVGLVATVVVCTRLLKGATSEELLDEFRRWNEKEVQRRRARQMSRVLDGI